MGFTRYWETTEKEKFDEKHLEEIKDILLNTQELTGVKLGDGRGENEPIIEENRVVFNGDTNSDLDYETASFKLTGKVGDFEFCKSARRPYDAYLHTIQLYLSDKGYIKNLYNDDFNQSYNSQTFKKLNEYCVEKGYLKENIILDELADELSELAIENTNKDIKEINKFLDRQFEYYGVDEKDFEYVVDKINENIDKHGLTYKPKQKEKIDTEENVVKTKPKTR